MSIFQKLKLLIKGLFTESGSIITENKVANELILNQAIADAESKQDKIKNATINLKKDYILAEEKLSNLESRLNDLQQAGEKLYSEIETSDDKEKLTNQLEKISQEMSNVEALIEAEKHKKDVFKEAYDESVVAIKDIETQISEAKNAKSLLDAKETVLEVRKDSKTNLNKGSEINTAISLIESRKNKLRDEEAKIEAAIHFDKENNINIDDIIKKKSKISFEDRFSKK